MTEISIVVPTWFIYFTTIAFVVSTAIGVWDAILRSRLEKLVRAQMEHAGEGSRE